MTTPENISTEEQLEELLAAPQARTIELMRRLEGDIMILGAGGKMGPSLARLALNACREAGVTKRIIAVSRFSESRLKTQLTRAGIETIACDLADFKSVETLPPVQNIIYMAGRKFGEVGSDPLTWLMNTVVPGHVAQVLRPSSMVVFSTGCVYPLVDPQTGGCTETQAPAPVGEYANSCLGRERIFQHFSEQYGSRVLLLRLNYAVDLRYGVPVDIAINVLSGRPVDLTINWANIIWQGEANNRVLLCLEHTASPAAILNLTGQKTLSVKEMALLFGKEFGREVSFSGSDSGKAFLSDASASLEKFGPLEVTEETLLKWVAHWVRIGGRNLNKPTHYQVKDGQFLDSTE